MKKYNLINKFFLSKVLKITPKRIVRKIIKKNKLYFVPTKLLELPKENHPVLHSYADQKKYLENFKVNNVQKSFMTYPYLTQLLLTKFKKYDEFCLLDIGGENIDFYLDLKKQFNNMKYYVFNQKRVLENLNKLKDEYFLQDFNIISNLDDIYNFSYEFINFGSSIHYFNNYEEVLKDITQVSKNYIFFSGIHLYKNNNSTLGNSLIVKQINLFPISLFCYFFNRDYFLKHFMNKGFVTVFEKKNITDNVNYKNFQNLFVDAMYTDLLLSNK